MLNETPDEEKIKCSKPVNTEENSMANKQYKQLTLHVQKGGNISLVTKQKIVDDTKKEAEKDTVGTKVIHKISLTKQRGNKDNSVQPIKDAVISKEVCNEEKPSKDLITQKEVSNEERPLKDFINSKAVCNEEITLNNI